MIGMSFVLLVLNATVCIHIGNIGMTGLPKSVQLYRGRPGVSADDR